MTDDDRPETEPTPEEILARYKRFQEEALAGTLKAAAADPTVMATLRGAFAEQLRTMEELGIPVKPEWWELAKPPKGMH